MDNLPLAKFNRDEVYTFIAGLFVALAWYLALQTSDAIAKSTVAIAPALLFAWLLSTAVVYIVYAGIMSWVIMPICQSRIESMKPQDEDAQFKTFKLPEKWFVWAAPLEEGQLQLHIFALVVVSLILAYSPILSLMIFVGPSSFWLIVLHLTYTLVVLTTYLLLSQGSHHLHLVNHFVRKGYLDTADQATYLHERAVFFAKIKNDDYLASVTDRKA